MKMLQFLVDVMVFVGAYIRIGVEIIKSIMFKNNVSSSSKPSSKCTPMYYDEVARLHKLINEEDPQLKCDNRV